MLFSLIFLTYLNQFFWQFNRFVVKIRSKLMTDQSIFNWVIGASTEYLGSVTKWCSNIFITATDWDKCIFQHIFKFMLTGIAKTMNWSCYQSTVWLLQLCTLFSKWRRNQNRFLLKLFNIFSVSNNLTQLTIEGKQLTNLWSTLDGAHAHLPWNSVNLNHVVWRMVV